MKRIIMLLSMIVLVLGFGGCENSTNGLKKSTIGENKEIKLDVTYDYGKIEEGKATLLVGESVLFFDPNDYDIKLTAGMNITVVYDGNYIVSETYPSIVDTKKMNIIDVIVSEMDTVIYKVHPNPGGGVSLAINDDRFGSSNWNFTTSYIIDADGTYHYPDEYEDWTTVYGVYKVDSVEKFIAAFYSYNPLVSSVE